MQLNIKEIFLVTQKYLFSVYSLTAFINLVA